MNSSSRPSTVPTSPSTRAPASTRCCRCQSLRRSSRRGEPPARSIIATRSDEDYATTCSNSWQSTTGPRVAVARPVGTDAGSLLAPGLIESVGSGLGPRGAWEASESTGCRLPLNAVEDEWSAVREQSISRTRVARRRARRRRSVRRRAAGGRLFWACDIRALERHFGDCATRLVWIDSSPMQWAAGRFCGRDRTSPGLRVRTRVSGSATVLRVGVIATCHASGSACLSDQRRNR